MAYGYQIGGHCVASAVEAAAAFCALQTGISAQGANTCTLATISGGQIEWRLTTVTANPSASYSRTQTQPVQPCELQDLAYWEPAIFAFMIALAGILAAKLLLRSFNRDTL